MNYTALNYTPLKMSQPTISTYDKTGHITQELYKKNYELAERNKTLAILRKIDEIILSSVTNIEEVARHISETVIIEAGFKAVYIFLINQKDKLLYPLAISLSHGIKDLDPDLQRVIYSMKISTGDIDNLIINSINNQKMQQTSSLYALFKSYLTQDACQKIQGTAKMRYFRIYPLVIRDHPIGAMIICPKEDNEPFFTHLGDLTDRLPQVVSIAIDNALLYQKIEQANIRLKELDKLKDEFVSLASHELRTPMTAIKSYIWMILNKSQKPLPADVKNYLEIASQETEHLIRLVQNMLTISRIEGQRMELALTNLDLFEMVKHIYATLKIKAEEKQLTFTLLPFPEKLIVNADKDKLAEVFENVIGNALKYTPNNGNISIHFTTEKNKVEVHISDSGPGISQDDLTKLFHKFGRLIEAKKSRTPGTGLGLYITKQIVELHKGEVKVESEVGKGTVFSIILPLAQQAIDV